MKKYIVYWTEKHLFESEPIEAKDQDEALALFLEDQSGLDRGDPPEPYDIVTDEVEIEEVNDED